MGIEIKCDTIYKNGFGVFVGPLTERHPDNVKFTLWQDDKNDLYTKAGVFCGQGRIEKGRNLAEEVGPVSKTIGTGVPSLAGMALLFGTKTNTGSDSIVADERMVSDERMAELEKGEEIPTVAKIIDGVAADYPGDYANAHELEEWEEDGRLVAYPPGYASGDDDAGLVAAHEEKPGPRPCPAQYVIVRETLETATLEEARAYIVKNGMYGARIAKIVETAVQEISFKSAD